MKQLSWLIVLAIAANAQAEGVLQAIKTLQSAQVSREGLEAISRAAKADSPGMKILIRENVPTGYKDSIYPFQSTRLAPSGDGTSGIVEKTTLLENGAVQQIKYSIPESTLGPKSLDLGSKPYFIEEFAWGQIRPETWVASGGGRRVAEHLTVGPTRTFETPHGKLTEHTDFTVEDFTGFFGANYTNYGTKTLRVQTSQQLEGKNIRLISKRQSMRDADEFKTYMKVQVGDREVIYHSILSVPSTEGRVLRFSFSPDGTTFTVWTDQGKKIKYSVQNKYPNQPAMTDLKLVEVARESTSLDGFAAKIVKIPAKEAQRAPAIEVETAAAGAQ